MIAQQPSLSQERLWSQIVARVWSDEDFKERFMLDPRGVLVEHGLDVPEGVDIKVLEDTAKLRHIVLPPIPSDELTDEELVGSSPGVADSYSGWCGACGRCGCGCRRCGCRCD